ncbi:MAG: hypothetical protein ACK4GD_07020 [Sphingomonadaceae bacterium]
MMRFGTILAVLALAACGPAGNDPGPGGVTVDEAKALDEAAEMLEERRLPDDALSDRPPDEDASGKAEPPTQ